MLLTTTSGWCEKQQFLDQLINADNLNWILIKELPEEYKTPPHPVPAGSGWHICKEAAKFKSTPLCHGFRIRLGRPHELLEVQNIHTNGFGFCGAGRKRKELPSQMSASPMTHFITVIRPTRH